MGGLLGGLVKLFELVGGTFWASLIGKSIWQKDSNSSKMFRVLSGSSLFGIVLSIMAIVLTDSFSEKGTVWIALIGSTCISVGALLGAFLGALKIIVVSETTTPKEKQNYTVICIGSGIISAILLVFLIMTLMA